jgi:glycosyltransferase involved in cell wall biosynthesis
MEKASYHNCPFSDAAIIYFPWRSEAPYIFISQLERILSNFTESVVIIGGNTNRLHVSSKRSTIRDIKISMHYVKEGKPYFISLPLWIYKSIKAQWLTAKEVKKLSRKTHIFFYMAYPYFLIPLLVCRLNNLKTIEVITRSASSDKGRLLSILMDPILYRLLNGVSFEDERLKRKSMIGNNSIRILANGARYIEIPNDLAITPPLNRKPILGYVGRLTVEKGIREFMAAVFEIGALHNDMEVVIVGDGDMRDWVIKESDRISAMTGIRIDNKGWLKGAALYDILKSLRLLIVPSHEEGLPTIVLEAMAYKTPVLSTPVGAIESIIQDGYSGFIIKSNKPIDIAKRIIEIMSLESLNNITTVACKNVLDKYSFESAVTRYKQMMEDIEFEE